VRAMTQKSELSLCYLFDTIKCYKQSRSRRRFHFKKIRTYMQTLKSKDKFVVRLQSRDSNCHLTYIEN
jgi:hypothetical protein